MQDRETGLYPLIFAEERGSKCFVLAANVIQWIDRQSSERQHNFFMKCIVAAARRSPKEVKAKLSIMLRIGMAEDSLSSNNMGDSYKNVLAFTDIYRQVLSSRPTANVK